MTPRLLSLPAIKIKLSLSEMMVIDEVGFGDWRRNLLFSFSHAKFEVSTRYQSGDI